MTNITSLSQYWNKIQSLAVSIAEDAMSSCDNNRDEAKLLINNSLLFETIVASQWTIHSAYHLDVLQYTGNPDRYVDEFGVDDAAIVLKERGLQGLYQALAFWALYADVLEKIEEALDEVEENFTE